MYTLYYNETVCRETSRNFRIQLSHAPTQPRCKEYTECGARSCSPRAVPQAGSAIFVDGNENENSATLTTTKNFTMNGVYF